MVFLFGNVCELLIQPPPGDSENPVKPIHLMDFQIVENVSFSQVIFIYSFYSNVFILHLREKSKFKTL